MAWEHINRIFPTGKITTTEGDTLLNNEIIQQDLKTITAIRTYATRNMFYKQDKYVWGSNGEFAIINILDVLNLFPHVDNIAPLNIYGMCMKNDFCIENNIQG